MAKNSAACCGDAVLSAQRRLHLWAGGPLVREWIARSAVHEQRGGKDQQHQCRNQEHHTAQHQQGESPEREPGRGHPAQCAYQWTERKTQDDPQHQPKQQSAEHASDPRRTPRGGTQHRNTRQQCSDLAHRGWPPRVLSITMSRRGC
jgi:hypothetical protein